MWLYQISEVKVTQSCPTLCDPMACSTPGLPVHHQLLELAQTHAIESVTPSNHLILCRSLLLLPSLFPSTRVFSSESVLHIRRPKIGVSVSASVLPLNIQDWFPSGWTGLISLQSKGLSRVFSKTLYSSPWTLYSHGILQARILVWGAVPFSRGSSQLRDRTQVSHIAGGFFTSWATQEAYNYWYTSEFK